MELEYIIPGHYVKKETLGSDGKNVEMIRVIKADPNNEGYWLIPDDSRIGKTKKIHESVLLNEYELLKVETPEHYKKTKNLLGDISKVKPPKQTISNQEEIISQQESTPFHNFVEDFDPDKSALKVNKQSVEVFQETKKESPKYSFDINIVNKCNIDIINKESKEKFGEQYIEINDEPVNFNLLLKLGYDISKLKQLIELLNLNVEEISQFLAEQIIDKIDLKKTISNRIFDMLNGNLEPTKITKVETKVVESKDTEKEPTKILNQEEIPVKKSGLPNERELELLAKMRKSTNQNNTNSSDSNQEKIQEGIKSIDKILSNFI